MSVLKYGLTADNLDYTQKKIDNQRDFLKNEHFTTQYGQSKSLLDISMSANHSERYYNQVLNKVHTLDSYNLSIDNVPVFITATLDAPFHEMLKGKFRKFYSKYIISVDEDNQRIIYDKLTGQIVKNLVPNNDRYGYILDDIRDKKQLTVNQLYKILSYQMSSFLKSYVFKSMKKNGDDYSYIRVTEPMKSGVPHFHLLMYIDEKYMKQLHTSFHKYFSAPRNSKPLTMYDNKRVCTKPLSDGTEETQGFQWDINSATAYVLKYVLKSFRNVKNDEELDYLQAWYIMHRIPRIISSHTLIPQWVYQKISILEKDWFYLTDIKKSSIFECDSKENTFEFLDFSSGRNIIYDNGLLEVYYDGKLLSSTGQKKPKRITIQAHKLKYVEKLEIEPIRNRLIPVYFENIGRTLFMTKGIAPKPLYQFKTVSKMTINELWAYRDEFDFEIENIAKFIHINNELIRRDVLQGEVQSLNFEEDFRNSVAFLGSLPNSDYENWF